MHGGHFPGPYALTRPCGLHVEKSCQMCYQTCICYRHTTLFASVETHTRRKLSIRTVFKAVPPTSMPPLRQTKSSQSTLTDLKASNRRRIEDLARLRENRYGSDSPFDPVTHSLRARVSARVNADHPRGTKRSATVADEPSEDQGEDNEPGLQKSASTVGRRVRFLSPALARPKQRQRVDDGLNATETAPDEMWVAKGEVGPFNIFRFSQSLTLPQDRCKPYKLVERDIGKPQRSAKGSYECCVFCTGESWSCNPPDSWLEKAGSVLDLSTETDKGTSYSVLPPSVLIKSQSPLMMRQSKWGELLGRPKVCLPNSERFTCPLIVPRLPHPLLPVKWLRSSARVNLRKTAAVHFSISQ